MRFGLYLPNFGAFGRPERVVALAESAEAAGWHGIFLWDHVARPGSPEVVDPWIALAAVAARTQRLRLGALVTPLARRRPWKVARETVSLDHLSQGRLVFGAGLGSGRREEWEGFGELTDARLRAERLDEALEILAGLWGGKSFSFEGRHHQVRDVTFLPAPLQQPRIPVWIGGYWPHRAPFRRAARWDGAFPLFDPAAGDSIAQLAECAAFLRAERRDPGPFDLVHLAPPHEARHLQAEAAGATWWLARLTPDAFDSDWHDPWPLAAMEHYVAAGPPARSRSGPRSQAPPAIPPASPDVDRDSAGVYLGVSLEELGYGNLRREPR